MLVTGAFVTVRTFHIDPGRADLHAGGVFHSTLINTCVSLLDILEVEFVVVNLGATKEWRFFQITQ